MSSVTDTLPNADQHPAAAQHSPTKGSTQRSLRGFLSFLITPSASIAIQENSSWRVELRAVLALAFPVILQTASQQAMLITDQMFLGRLGTAQMAAAAIGNTWLNLMWYFLMGCSSALDTLGSQAYGAGDRTALVTWSFSAFLVLTTLCVPVSFGLASGAWTARVLFGQGGEVSALVGKFCAGLIAGMPPEMWSLILMKYLQTQNVMALPALVTVTAFFLNIGANAVMIPIFGFVGSAMATSSTRIIQFFMMMAVVYYYEHNSRRVAHEQLQLLQQHPSHQHSDSNSHTSCRPKAGERKEDCQSGAGSRRAESGSDLGLEGSVTDEQFVGVCLLRVGGLKGGVSRGSSSCLQAGDSSSSSSSSSSIAAIAALSADGAEHVPPAVQGATHPGAQQRRQGPHPGQPTDDGGTAQLTLQNGAGGAAGTCSTAAAPASLAPASGACRDRQRSQGRRSQLGAASVAVGVAARSDCVHSSAPQCQEVPALGVREVVSYVWAQSKAACDPRTMWSFLKIGIPGGLCLAFEFGAFEVTTALAGRLGTAKVAAHTAMLLITTMTYFCGGLPLATAASIRVGNLLGAGFPKTARLTSLISISLSTAFMAVMGVLLLALRNQLGLLYTDDPEVRHWMSVIAPMAALFQMFDGVMGTSQGALSGCGRQHQLMFINLFGFWVCGVLVGALLCFKAGMGLRGLWWGTTIGDIVTAVISFSVFLRVDWDTEALIAKSRQQELQALDEPAGKDEQDPERRLLQPKL
ncbi:MAG: hypothetical protein WDW36_009548 [Sanguina aurantia]